MPYRLAGYGDEISSDIQRQMDGLLEAGINFCALRTANTKGLLELEDFQVNLTKTQFFNRKIRFSCVEAPLGRSLITEPFESELVRAKHSWKRAKDFEVKVVLIQAYLVPQGAAPGACKDEVIKRIKVLAEQAKAEGLNLLVENGKGTYADNGSRFAEVFNSVQSPNLMAAFDPASFTSAGEDPVRAWDQVKQWVKDIHIRDVSVQGGVTLPGRGNACLKEILRFSLKNNWSGLLTLEPQMSKSEAYKDQMTWDSFKVAAAALQEILKEIGVAQ